MKMKWNSSSYEPVIILIIITGSLEMEFFHWSDFISLDLYLIKLVHF